VPTVEHLGDPPEPAARSRALLGDRWLLLMLTAFGVMALVVVTVVGFSGAYFSSRSTSPDNAFTATTVKLTVSKSGSIIDGAGLAPGVSKSGTQTVTNGAHRAAVTLATSGLPPTSKLADVLTVVVSQTGQSADTVYQGPLSGLGTVQLGTFEKGEQRSYQVVVTWPAGQADPSLQGASVAFSFDWLATAVA